MTVTAETSSITYTGNGATVAFAFPYRFLENAHLRVIRTVISTGGETELVLDSGGANGFTATGAGTPGGGTITVVTAPTALQRLTIDLGNIPATQEQAYVPNTTLPAQTVERALDKLTMLVQSVIGGGIARVLRLIVGDTDGSGRYNANGNRIVALADGEEPTDAATVQQLTAASLGTFIQSGAGATIREAQSKLRDPEVSPEDFGAVGDGTTNDTAALVLAMATGRVVNGNGRTFAVSGNLEPSSGFKGLRNITLSQLTPSGGNRRTLLIVGLSDFVLDRVTVLRNGTGAEYTTLAQMSENAGIYLSGCSEFIADNLDVSGGGVGTGIAVVSCSKFEMRRPHAHDMNYVLGASPLDDRIQGIWFDTCSDFTVFKPTVRDLGGNFGSGATTRYTRAVTLGGCSRFDIHAADVSDVDQGIDMTGSVGNSFGTFHGGRAQNCYTYGWKAANSQRWVTVVGAVAEDCGFAGFVASGQSDVSNPTPHDLRFIGCMAHDTGSNGHWSASAVSGFMIQSSAAVDPSYPRGVKFLHCRAVDDQAVKTMKYGFLNEVANTGFGDRNEVVDCTSEGHTVAQASGFHFAQVRLVPDSQQSIPNNTVTNVNWQTEVYDTSALHSTSSNIDVITIREAGYYVINAVIQYDANVTGRRGCRILQNGVLVPGSNNLIPAAATGATVVPAQAMIYCNANDSITIGAFQDSGGALNTTTAGCSVQAAMLAKN